MSTSITRPNFRCLNWKELELLVQKLAPQVEGLFVERMIIPERARFSEGYLKGEWVLRLTGRKQECVISFSLRPRHPSLAFHLGKGPKASTLATHSPFDQNLSKHIKGAKLLKLESVSRERIAILWFSEEGNSHNKLGLILVLIPAAPEAFLVTAPLTPTDDLQAAKWRILARSRTVRDEAKNLEFYLLPDGTQAPPDPPIRSEILESAESFHTIIEKEILAEAYTLRLQNAAKAIRQLLKQVQVRIRQSETALREGQSESNWQRFGDLLKFSLGNPPPLEGKSRRVMDYESETEIDVPCDPRFTLTEQIEKFYQNAKRKQRRIQEAQTRVENFQGTLQRLQAALDQTSTETTSPSGDWNVLQKLEQIAQIAPPTTSTSSSKVSPGKKRSVTSAWLGKSFASEVGLLILVGRSKDENLELTFKHARGNDIWLHVRGRPGAHVLVPLQPGKTAPLETLLDAATLAIYYSGGENWGKTEVDYTFKKYVKRIKDSSEASYTNNKTLLIDQNAKRLQRLLSQQN